MSRYSEESADYKRGYADGQINAIEHGHWDDEWFDHEHKIVCSACDCFADKMTDYCPNCGAKMDEIVEPEDPRDLYGWER